MIKYTLFKPPISCDYSEMTQNIVRYAYKELDKDIRPTNIIEREYPDEIGNNLPSVYLWEGEEYIIGGENVISWMENVLHYPNLREEIKEWIEKNSDYIIDSKYNNRIVVEDVEGDVEGEEDNNDDGIANNYSDSEKDDNKLNRIITFCGINLWSDRFDREPRFNNFCEVMKNIEPDIICIQDINETMLQKLIQQEWSKIYFKSAYHISKNPNITGEVIFSKFPIMHKEIFPFNNTTNGQTVHIAHIQIPLNYFQQSDVEMDGMSFPVITAQLEKNSEIRKEQLYSMFNMVLPISNVFMLVDTNLTDEDTDFINLPEGWKDGFEENFSNLEQNNMDNEQLKEYAEKNTFTYDSEINSYISGYQRYRYDRIFYKSKDPTCGWKCVDFQLICNDVIVSNHFGIFATFEHI